MAVACTESFYSNKINKVVCSGDLQLIANRQIIIQSFNGEHHTGGLTDRLKGICTLYQFSKKHNIPYKLFFVNPFDLTKYLIPNRYDWTIREEQIIRNLQYSAIYTWENEKDAEIFFEQNHDKLQLHIGCNSRECYNNYSELFNELFLPTEFLKNALATHYKALGGKGNYVSISFRFQNMLGEFTETTSKPLSDDKQKQLIDRCLEGIGKIKNENDNIERILITSDSNYFRDIANDSYTYTYIIPEEVGHIDYSGGKSKELTAFLDMFLIAGARWVYQVRNCQMYNSDFPVMAAQLGGVGYEMREI
jgi:hypothetical protein